MLIIVVMIIASSGFICALVLLSSMHADEVIEKYYWQVLHCLAKENRSLRADQISLFTKIDTRDVEIVLRRIMDDDYAYRAHENGQEVYRVNFQGVDEVRRMADELRNQPWYTPLKF